MPRTASRRTKREVSEDVVSILGLIVVLILLFVVLRLLGLI